MEYNALTVPTPTNRRTKTIAQTENQRKATNKCEMIGTRINRPTGSNLCIKIMQKQITDQQIGKVRYFTRGFSACLNPIGAFSWTFVMISNYQKQNHLSIPPPPNLSDCLILFI